VVELPINSWSVKRAHTVVVADDEPMFRASLRQLLSVPPTVVREVYGVDVGAGFEVVGEAGTGEDTVAVVQKTRPDLLLLDLSMPRLSGLEALRLLHGDAPSPRTLVLSGSVQKAQLMSAVQLGARGVVLKDSTTELLFEAIATVMAGQSWLGKTLVTDLMEMVGSLSREQTRAAEPFGLTPRERQVLALVVRAAAIGRSPRSAPSVRKRSSIT